MSNMLQGKRAAMFGAGGSIGAAVAREFAAEGAEVFLSGRTRSNVEEVSKQITSAGGRSRSTNRLADHRLSSALAEEHDGVDRYERSLGGLRRRRYDHCRHDTPRLGAGH